MKRKREEKSCEEEKQSQEHIIVSTFSLQKKK